MCPQQAIQQLDYHHDKHHATITHHLHLAKPLIHQNNIHSGIIFLWLLILQLPHYWHRQMIRNQPTSMIPNPRSEMWIPQLQPQSLLTTLPLISQPNRHNHSMPTKPTKRGWHLTPAMNRGVTCGQFQRWRWHSGLSPKTPSLWIPTILTCKLLPMNLSIWAPVSLWHRKPISTGIP